MTNENADLIRRAYRAYAVRDGRVVALRDYRDRQEALDLTGTGESDAGESLARHERG